MNYAKLLYHVHGFSRGLPGLLLSHSTNLRKTEVESITHSQNRMILKFRFEMAFGMVAFRCLHVFNEVLGQVIRRIPHRKTACGNAQISFVLLIKYTCANTSHSTIVLSKTLLYIYILQATQLYSATDHNQRQPLYLL